MKSRACLLVAVLSVVSVGQANSGDMLDPSEEIFATGPWIDVRRFGAVGDGLADDTVAIQRAIAAANPDDLSAAGNGHGDIVYFPPGVYRISDTLNMRWLVSLRGAGMGSSRIQASGSGLADKPMISCIGKGYCGFDDLEIYSPDPSNKPSIGIVYGRSSSSASAGRHRIQRCRIGGYFTHYAHYSVGSEGNVYDQVTFTLVAGKACLGISASDFDSLCSLPDGSNTRFNFYGCIATNYQRGDPNNRCLILHGPVADLAWYGGYMIGGGDYCIEFTGRQDAWIYNVKFDQLRMESFLDGHSQTCIGWTNSDVSYQWITFENCSLWGETAILYAADDVLLNKSRFANNHAGRASEASLYHFKSSQWYGNEIDLTLRGHGSFSDFSVAEGRSLSMAYGVGHRIQNQDGALWGAGEAPRSVRATSLTDVVRSGLDVEHRTSNGIADGFGVAVRLGVRDDKGNGKTIGALQAVRSGSDDTGFVGLVPFRAGVESPGLWVSPSGHVTIGSSAAVEPNTVLQVHGSLTMDDGDLIYQVFNISSGARAFNTYGIHIIDSSQGAISGWLPAAQILGQRVKFVCKKAGHNIDIHVSHHVDSDPKVIRLDQAKEWVELVWDGTDWVETGGQGQTQP